MTSRLYSRGLKRTLDITLVLCSAPLLVPLFAVTACLVRVVLGTPVLFRQERPGLNGRPFPLLKFRSMTDARGTNGEVLPDGERLTTFGRFLRSTSLDELPELINVLRGEMSLVGPRPLLTEYLALYNAEQRRRHEVRPGITGWAQVNGRNRVTWEDKFNLDVWYTQHLSFFLDVRILAQTLLSVIRRDGVEFPGLDSMPFFRGSEDHETTGLEVMMPRAAGRRPPTVCGKKQEGRS
jgi:sugar transferase EpsL